MDKLIVGSNAWAEIDAATFRASGDLQKIKLCMEEALSSQSVDALCENLGILVSSFAFRNETLKRTQFYREGETPETYHTNYLLTNQTDRDDYGDFLHSLFVRVRTISERSMGETFRPDYQLHMPLTEVEEDTRSKFEQEEAFRSRYLAHYCTLGETLMTCLVWRRLHTLLHAGHADGLLANQSLELNASTQDQRNFCNWLGVNLLVTEPLIAGFRAKLRALWGPRIGPQDEWCLEWRLLGLGTEPDERWGWDAVQNFLQSSGFNLGSHCQSELNELLDRATPEILGHLLNEAGCSDWSVKDAVTRLEIGARFPILPFYAWISLDQMPRVFCVSPVWLSQSVADEFSDGDTRILGYAVSGVKPIEELDWSIPQSSSWRARFSSSQHPQLVFSMLRLMAKPLVEAMLYEQAITTARKKSDARTRVERLTGQKKS